MSNLVSFILNTLQGPVNDPENTTLWLPKLLYTLKNDDGHKVLPVKAEKENLGAIENSNGIFLSEQIANTWIIYLQTHDPGITSSAAIPDPSNPYPSLSLTNMNIDGLQNVYALVGAATAHSDGYKVTVPLNFNHYGKTVGGVPMTPLRLVSGYSFTASVCTTTDGKTCNGEISDTLTGEGSLTAEIADAQLQAELLVTVNGTGTGRTLGLALDTLTLTGIDDKGPTFDITEITITNFKYGSGFSSFIKQAMTSGQGQAAVFGSVNNALNTPDNIDAVSKALLSRAGDILDRIFGPPPAGGLPSRDSGQEPSNPVDLLLFDRMRGALGTPASNWYLPWQVASLDDPVVDPYGKDRIEIGTKVFKGLTYKDITLTDLVIAGTSNVEAPVDTVFLASPKITATLDFGLLKAGGERTVKRDGHDARVPVPAAPPLSVTFGFAMTQEGISPVDIKGTVAVTVTGMTATLSITPSGDKASELVLDVGGFAVDLSAATVTPTVTLDPPNPFLQGVVEQFFQSDTVKTDIADAITTQLTDQESEISKSVSASARAAIHAQLYS